MQKVNKELGGVAKRLGRIREYTELSPNAANIMPYWRLKIAVSFVLRSSHYKANQFLLIEAYVSDPMQCRDVNFKFLNSHRCQFQIFNSAEK